ncbi:hypothetical protein DH86_00002311, partial [Scytalidium sp. 3C]
QGLGSAQHAARPHHLHRHQPDDHRSAGECLQHPHITSLRGCLSRCHPPRRDPSPGLRAHRQQDPGDTQDHSPDLYQRVHSRAVETGPASLSGSPPGLRVQASRQFIASEYPWFLETFDNYAFPIQRADAIRYFVLAHYGGVYIDLDDGCNRRLDPLLSYPAWVRRTVPTGISNDAMGAVPQHPFFIRV